MSLKISRKKPVQIFLVAVVISMTGIYWLCDYYLNSVGHELMLNWARTESALIQQGNLLTSSTKNQRFLLSSDYVRAVKLVKIDKDQIRERLHFGDPFSLETADIPEMKQEVVIKRVGFLHSRAFYKIPGRDEMFLIFDVESKVLSSVFFGGVAFLLLMLIALVAVIRSVENQEYVKREEIFKQAINDFISKDRPSEVVEKALPTLMTWWKDKKNQVEAAHQLAIQNQSKIMLGEIAARVGHDIIGSVRNIEILSRRSTGLTEDQKNHLNESISKIKTIVSDISKQTKKSLEEGSSSDLHTETIDLNRFLEKLVDSKRIQFTDQVSIELITNNCADVLAEMNSLEFERSISNLISNAVEASTNGSKIIVELSSDNNSTILQIKDFGKGISKGDLEKIGSKGFTSGKENGTGIGVYYAKKFVESIGGKLEFESTLGKGTVVSMSIPKKSEELHIIKIDRSEHLLILEDKKSNHIMIDIKFERAGVNKSAYTIVSTPSELENWLATNQIDFKLYSDYHLETANGEKLESGTQVIKRLGLADRSILFTSAAGNETVIDAAKDVGVQVLSKDQFFEAEVKMETV